MRRRRGGVNGDVRRGIIGGVRRRPAAGVGPVIDGACEPEHQRGHGPAGKAGTTRASVIQRASTGLLLYCPGGGNPAAGPRPRPGPGPQAACRRPPAPVIAPWAKTAAFPPPALRPILPAIRSAASARLTDCSVIPSSRAAIFCVPCVPVVIALLHRALSTSTTFHWAADRSCTSRPISRSTASALAQARAPADPAGRRSGRSPAQPLRRQRPAAHGRIPDLAFSTATPRRHESRPGSLPRLAGSGRSTAPHPDSHVPASASQGVQGDRPPPRPGRATTPWTSSPTERSKRPAVDRPASSARAARARGLRRRCCRAGRSSART